MGFAWLGMGLMSRIMGSTRLLDPLPCLALAFSRPAVGQACPMSSAQLLARVLTTNRMLQRDLAKLLGYDRKTISRWLSGGTILLPHHFAKLAAATVGNDRAFAAELAALGGKTLVDLGLESPPAPAAPPVPARPSPSSKHLVDSVVCAAAEAMQTPPHAMRPALVAAFERAVALGMTMEGVIEGLGTTKAAKAKA
jgi:transcriptional regulator with XRE-family HTH domain